MEKEGEKEAVDKRRGDNPPLPRRLQRRLNPLMNWWAHVMEPAVFNNWKIRNLKLLYS